MEGAGEKHTLYSCPEHSLFVIGNLRPGAGWSIPDVLQPYFRSQTAALPGDPVREAKGGTLLLRQVSQW